ncbi:hypothetical protein BQ8482_120002 [Mesorhizobium delmotii]|uniref:Uncharacterized protein n=1 Tax=Mesorhizobium delmotii TaxID=1631247 RepID=A0A2P9AFN6_9HYPH|nr:hypothetical protein BQ8482_120002 [Mesorhizobium delmotii]
MRKRDLRSVGGTYAGVPLSQVRHGMEVQWTIIKTRIMLVVAEPTGIGFRRYKGGNCALRSKGIIANAVLRVSLVPPSSSAAISFRMLQDCGSWLWPRIAFSAEWLPSLQPMWSATAG